MPGVEHPLAAKGITAEVAEEAARIGHEGCGGHCHQPPLW